MKILGASNVYNAYNPQKTTSIKKVDKNIGIKDDLKLSETAKDYQVAAKAVSKVDDVRQDKINDIKARIANGSYNVSDEDLANKILSGLE